MHVYIAQLCMWDYDDPCSIFPTLRFDAFVDTFFLATHTAPPPPVTLSFSLASGQDMWTLPIGLLSR